MIFTERMVKNVENRIKELRLERGLTLREMGNALDIRDNTLSQYENGKRSPQLGLIQEIANFFDVSVEYLLKSSDQRDFPLNNDNDAWDLLEKLGSKELSFLNISRLTATYLYLWVTLNSEKIKSKASDNQREAASRLVRRLNIENNTLKAYSERRKRDNKTVDKISDILLGSKTNGYPSPSVVLEFMEQSKRIGGLATEKIINMMRNSPDCSDDSY